jgi:hypothetical protein
LPPQPARQLELPASCDWLLLCSVEALLLALPLVAPLLADWLALFSPPVIEPPAMLTGTFALTAVCSASASDDADWLVLDNCPDACAWPLPPQPNRQLELPAFWDWLLLWLVLALLLALPLVAPFVADWLALLLPPVIEPPAMFTGTFALTAVCLATASDSADCSVCESWKENCAWPLPPQPTMQLELPAFWDWVLLWLVLALLLALPLVAPLLADWLAVLLPLVTEPPAMLTGVFELTASCSAVASDSADWSVVEDWLDSCAWPLPPQPATQLELPAFWDWLLLWLVLALLLAVPLVAPLVAPWEAVLLPPEMFPAAWLTGALPLTAVWAAFASDSAVWIVAAHWLEAWA